jgi:hypothetical protein
MATLICARWPNSLSSRNALFAAALVLAAGCGARRSAERAPRPRYEDTLVTDLDVEIIDLERVRARCDGVPSRRVAVEVDGRRGGEVAIECTTTLIAPPEIFPIEVHVPPGQHVLRIVDLATGRDGSRAFRFPVLEPLPGGGAILAEHLQVTIDTDGIDIGPVLGFRGRL